MSFGKRHAAAGIALLGLVGCTGNGNERAPVDATYPGLANIVTATTLSSLTRNAVQSAASTQATPTTNTVRIDWTSTTIRVIVTGAAGQAFDQTFVLGPPGSANLLATLVTPGVTLLEGSVITLTDQRALSLTQLGGGPPSFDHTVLGRWTYTDLAGPTTSVGYFVAGTETRVADIPATGTAAYTGRLLGNLYDPAVGSAARVTANATGSFNFGTGILQFSSTGSRLITPASGTPILTDTLAPSLDILPTNLTLAAGTNSLTGTFATDAGRNLSGPAEARCFGPACSEVGGVFNLTNGVAIGNPGAQQMIGGFVLSQ